MKGAEPTVPVLVEKGSRNQLLRLTQDHDVFPILVELIVKAGNGSVAAACVELQAKQRGSRIAPLFEPIRVHRQQPWLVRNSQSGIELNVNLGLHPS